MAGEYPTIESLLEQTEEISQKVDGLKAEVARLRRIENAALRVVSSCRRGMPDTGAMTALEASLEATS